MGVQSTTSLWNYTAIQQSLSLHMMSLFPAAVLWISLSPSFSQQFFSLSITFSSLISKKILVPFSSIFYIPLHSFFIFSIWMEKWYGFSNIYFFIWQNMAHPPISFKSYKELMFLSPFFLRSHFSIWNWQVGQTIVIPLTSFPSLSISFSRNRMKCCMDGRFPKGNLVSCFHLACMWSVA